MKTYTTPDETIKFKTTYGMSDGTILAICIILIIFAIGILIIPLFLLLSPKKNLIITDKRLIVTRGLFSKPISIPIEECSTYVTCNNSLNYSVIKNTVKSVNGSITIYGPQSITCNNVKQFGTFVHVLENETGANFKVYMS